MRRNLGYAFQRRIQLLECCVRFLASLDIMSGRYRPTPTMRATRNQIPPRDTNCAAITLRWISLVPSPTIISGASRKYRSTSYSVE